MAQKWDILNLIQRLIEQNIHQSIIILLQGALVFFVWTLLPCLYIAWRFVFKLPLTICSKIILLTIMVLGCEFHFFTLLVTGNMFSPELTNWLMLVLGWWFGCLVLFAVMLICRDIVSVVLTPFSQRKTSLNRCGMVLLIISMLLAALGINAAVSVPQVKTVELYSPRLPAAFDGFRIVQLSDLHVSALLTGKWLKNVVSRTNKTVPDLILLTGDMSDGYLSDRKRDIAALANLTAPNGVYAITGNHEYYFDYHAWMKEYQRLGIPLLFNSHVRIARQNSSIIIAGLNDDSAELVGVKGPDIADALYGTRAEDAIVLMDHRPVRAQENARYNVMLQLSGHTHGGMIEGFDLLIKPANQGYVSGYYQVGDMALYVNNGAGIWNGFPLRLGRRSEITLFILRSGFPAGVEQNSTKHPG
ncbi:hypothetical protein EC841_101361 [Raoultella ornithinolytica]|uniref:Calcineurin-like phosphoesterase domain-containing protein n=1 Tax=Raoultella ornithinolytica TaxID=54291 RepID=A0ABD7QNQ5_RAOOR|nr:hypothetical protein EC841_101361 [Raoultella ornithinolytica]